MLTPFKKIRIISEGIVTFLLVISGVDAQSNCNKLPFHAVNYIRNPSFEDISVDCHQVNPNRYNNLTGMDFWIYPVFPSPASIRYMNDCNNYQGNGYYTKIPMPIPDGKAVLGIFDGGTIAGGNNDIVSEKTAVVSQMLHLLKKDTLYKITFYLGYGEKQNCAGCGSSVYRSPQPETISIYGLADSTLLPFQSAKGCLTQINKLWLTLGTSSVYTDGNSQWVKDSILFTPAMDIQAIAIGPSCNSGDLREDNDGGPGGYIYFLDMLQLYEASAPAASLAVSAGSLCDAAAATITLQLQQAAYYQGSQLQWYKNNTAIPETKNNLTITPNHYGEGWYQCAVMNDTVCIHTDSFHVAWAPVTTATIGGSADTVACMGDTVLLKVNGGTGASYLWNDGSTASSKKVTTAGTYSVQINNACAITTAAKKVDFKNCPYEMYLPSAFTPNHDGLNDVFRARYKGPLQSFRLSVYNRFGQRIFYNEDIGRGWDGTIKGIAQNQGVFVWVLDYTDGQGAAHSMKGTVTLIK